MRNIVLRMAKLLKIIGRSIGILLEWILIFVILLAFAIRTAPVQTYIAQKATNYLSKELGTTVKVDGISITFFDELAVDGVLILDQQNDTLIAAKTIFASITELNINKNHFKLDEVTLVEGYAHIKKDQEGEINLQFIKDYFKSDSKKQNAKSMFLDISKVKLENCKFRYDDNRQEAIEKGVDYFHLGVHSVNGNLENISIVDDHIKADILSFNLIGNSGFHLKNLTAKADVSGKGVFLSELNIESDKTKISAPKFNLVTNHYDDFNHFVDSVKFDAQIAQSSVSLEDVALFGHALDGMNDIVELKVNVSKTINNLALKDLDLRFGQKSVVQGNLNLPEFSDIENAIFFERIKYAYIDIDELEALRMPNSMSSPYLKFDAQVNRLEFFEAKDIRLDGYYSNFVLASDIVNTQLGAVRLNNGIMFTPNSETGSLYFQRSENSTYDVKVENFDLGGFLANNSLGTVDGIFFLTGEAKSTTDIRFTNIEGDLNHFDFMGYAYENINIADGTFEDGIFDAKIDIKDDALDLAYDGYIDLNGDQQMKFTVNVEKALLERMGFTTENSNLHSSFEVDIIGTDPNNYKGTIVMNGFVYSENGKEFNVPQIVLDVQRNPKEDIFKVKSTIADATIIGKINFDYLWYDISNQMSRIFPALFKKDVADNRKENKDHFTFNAEIKKINPFLAIFAPDLTISNGTKIDGHYFGESSNFILNLSSDTIIYDGMRFNDVALHQILDSNSLVATYHVNRFDYNDSLSFNDLYFKSSGGNNNLDSEFTWDQNTPDASAIRWETNVKDINHYEFEIEPSYFSINQNRWEISNSSKIQFESDTVRVADFNLERHNQTIAINGQFSENDKDHLRFEMNEIELSELAFLLTDEFTMVGQLNAWGYISNPTKNFKYVADANLMDFAINENEIGNIFVQSDWDKKTESINVNGDLMYRGVRTFDFVGNYAMAKDNENLDFKLIFDQTDIRFTNAFLDPDVVSEIRGFLNGAITLKGSPSSPEMDGVVNLNAASANIGILGAHFGLDGPIEIDKYGFYINSIPVFDEEGNAGSLIGSVYHDNFSDFNFDLMFDLEDDAVNRDPIQPWKALPLEKFLVMNSTYSPDEVYYGKAYVNGTANIFGYSDNLEITVDVTTQKGTKVNFPMYGVGEIDEEDSFIDFVSKDSSVITDEPKIDFLGVDLDLNMHVTQDAEMKIIFNEELGDIITANGNGDITVRVDNLGDITMDGVYTVNNGVYDFAMGPVKQKFYIEKGGNIAWTGDPYNANLALKTYHKVNANIAELSPDQFGGANGAHDEVLCYLNLDQTLLSPAIEFDIKAPKANEQGQSLINRIKSDQDELNRQFFSLMLWKKFQPLQGQTSASGNAAVDLVANQINSLLSKVSSDYKMNVNLDSDDLTGDNTYEFGVSKGFLDDRLILSGSFGVENQKTEENSQSSIIGDLNLEYLLNESGTFRVDIFNESNDKTIIQDQQQGHFTQGVGVHYQEDFNTVQDFKAVQVFLDIFRKKENKRYPIKRKKKQTPVPKDGSYLLLPKEAIENEF